MIFVVGDIHGMIDPLRIAIQYIYHTSKKNIPITEIIFLGDYIDGGPSSKAVIDAIISLRQDFKVVTLLGNHEDMLLAYYHHCSDYVKTGNSWLSFNSGIQTIHSLYPQSIMFEQTFFPDEKTVADLIMQDGVLHLPPNYLEFFETLLPVYLHSLVLGEKKLDLVFSHATLSESYPLDRQLALQNWRDIRVYMQETACALDDTVIWNRQLLNQQIRENMIIIHGHTPTKYYRQLTKLLRFWEEEENAPFIVKDRKSKQPAQIDLDTGLVYGGSLSMLAIDDTPTAERVFPYYISIDPKSGYRHSPFKKIDLDIRVD